MLRLPLRRPNLAHTAARRVLLVALLLATAYACTLNPQPLPPATATKDGGVPASPGSASSADAGSGKTGDPPVPTPLDDAGGDGGGDFEQADGGADAGDAGDAESPTDGGADAGDASTG